MKPEEMDKVDRLLAVELMKWEYCSEGCCLITDELIDAPKTWSPTRKIEQALQVVDKLEEMGAEVVIRKTQTLIFFNGRWHEGLGKIRQKHMMKAALKALDLEIPRAPGAE